MNTWTCLIFWSYLPFRLNGVRTTIPCIISLSSDTITNWNLTMEVIYNPRDCVVIKPIYANLWNFRTSFKYYFKITCIQRVL